MRVKRPFVTRNKKASMTIWKSKWKFRGQNAEKGQGRPVYVIYIKIKLINMNFVLLPQCIYKS